jgi:exodeoxyribonuclease VII large subunit
MRQSLDDRAGRLARALPNLLAGRRAALVRAERGLPDPRMIVATRRSAAALAAERLRSAIRHAMAGRTVPRLSAAPLQGQLREARSRLDGLAARLDSVSYMKVLERGFALVTDARGIALSSVAAIKPGAGLRLRFADGEVRATAAGKTEARQASLLL